MRLVRADSDTLLASGRTRLGPTALSAFLVAAAAVVPLLGPQPLTLPRALTSLGLAVAAVLLGRASVQAARRVGIDLRTGRLESSGASRPKDRLRAVALTSSDPTFNEGLRPRYRAELVFDDGARWIILERDEPAGVLRDLAELRKALSVPVVRGWGLDDDAIRMLLAEHEPSAGHFEPGSIEAPGGAISARLGSAHVITALTFSIALAVGTLLVLVAARHERGEFVGPFSILLVGVAIAIMLTILAVHALHRVTVRANAEIRLERSIGPFKRFERTFRRRAVHAAFVTGAELDRVQHLLLSTDEGPVALPCPHSIARDVLGVLAR